MNPFFKLGTMLTIVAGAAMTISSCSSNDAPEFDPNAETKWNFQTEFVKQFGEIASNQNWGFHSVGVYTMPSSTRSVIKTDHPDYKLYEPAPQVTPAQINEVKDAFQDIEDFVSEPINFDRFFVQHVYMSNRTYPAGNNQDVVGSNHMDHLKVWKDDENGEHANDFNRNAGSTVLFINSGTHKFSYSNSTDGQEHFDYIVKQVGGYYYVGFSFKATGQNPNQKVEGDNNYDDWIVRIVPAKLKGEEDKNTQRIIVEDLGSIGDFDYNDLVFDAYVYNKDGQTWANIKLLAAGGTLPIYICGCDGQQVEVHDKFGVTTTTMVNTKNGTVDKNPVEFAIKLKNETSSSFNANDIEVKVNNNGTWMTLSSNVGEAPEKICVDNSFKWCDERQNIETKYQNFSQYVNNPSIGDWWK